jgi:hypothetical protein
MKTLMILFLTSFVGTISHATDPIKLDCGKTKRFVNPLSADNPLTVTATATADHAALTNCLIGLHDALMAYAKEQFVCPTDDCKFDGRCKSKIIEKFIDDAIANSTSTCIPGDADTFETCTCVLTTPSKFEAVCTECTDPSCLAKK